MSNVEVKLYLSNEKSITKLEAISAGLTGVALERFTRAAYEMELNVEVDPETGEILTMEYPKMVSQRGGF